MEICGVTRQCCNRLLHRHHFDILNTPLNSLTHLSSPIHSLRYDGTDVTIVFVTCHEQPEQPLPGRAARLRLPGAEQPACCADPPPAAPCPGSGCGTGAPSSQAALAGPPPPAPAANHPTQKQVHGGDDETWPLTGGVVADGELVARNE